MPDLPTAGYSGTPLSRKLGLAIDAVWSGLRCVYRLKDRPSAKPPE